MVVEALVIVAHNSTSITRKKHMPRQATVLRYYFYLLFPLLKLSMLPGSQLTLFINFDFLQQTNSLCLQNVNVFFFFFFFSCVLRWRREITNQFHSNLSSFPCKDRHALSNELLFHGFLLTEKQYGKKRISFRPFLIGQVLRRKNGIMFRKKYQKSLCSNCKYNFKERYAVMGPSGFFPYLV